MPASPAIRRKLPPRRPGSNPTSISPWLVYEQICRHPGIRIRELARIFRISSRRMKLFLPTLEARCLLIYEEADRLYPCREDDDDQNT